MFPKLATPQFKIALLSFTILLFIGNSTSLFAQINTANVEIVRDKWGVPHIYGKTDADATYGLAWATCEDDFNTVQRILLAGKGRLAEVDGKGGAVLDFLAFISGAEAIVDTAYETSFSPEYKKVIEAYTQGLNDYAAANSQELLRKGLFPVTTKDVIAQYILTNMLLTNVYIDIHKIFINKIGDYNINLPSGSNGIALNSTRTKDGKTYLAVNSHQPLEGLFSWYEAHIVSDEGLNILGGTFPGGMSIFLGTTPNLGWACTLNHPDLDDVYKLQINPKNHKQYWFNDHWETLEVRKKTIKVKLGAIRLPITKTFYWSKYGTTIKNKSGYYSIRFPANLSIKSSEELYHLNKAKTFTEWKNVMSKVAFPGVNFLYADRKDTIFFVSNGQFAYRDSTFDWKKVVPGNTSKTLWEPIYQPFDKLPQVLNPSSGYLINTNNSCFDASATQCNPKPENYDRTFGFTSDKNNRSIMGHYLISKQDKFSYEEFKKVKYNREFSESLYDYGLNNAQVMFNLSAEKYPDLTDALAVLKKWNRGSEIDNQEVALLVFAFTPLIEKISARATTYETNGFTEAEYVDALRHAKKHMLKYFGSITVPLGTVQKHVRGNVELPMGGMIGVLAANMTQEYKDGKRKSFVGDSYIQLVQYSKDTIEIETVNAYGASSKLVSPHATDQMQLFVDQKLKPMTLNKEAIYKNAERIYHPAILNKKENTEGTALSR